MKKKNIFITIILILLFGGLFFSFKDSEHSEKIINLENKNIFSNASSEKSTANQGDLVNQKKLFISTWVPYWQKDAGLAALKGNEGCFDEINPFAFSVDARGNLIDRSSLKNNPWKEFIVANKSKIVPTILWGSAQQMHAVFSDDAFTQKHIANIVAMLDENSFGGVDVDYEGKDVADKNNFSTFIIKLKSALQKNSKRLRCTVEARTQDEIPSGFSGVRAMAWANDLDVLGKQCDQVRVMAYDQTLQEQRASSFSSNDPNFLLANSSETWSREVVEYFLRYIPKEKLVLGISTYGWEFSVQKKGSGFHYEKIGSINYDSAMDLAKNVGAEVKRNQGGELEFSYQKNGGKRIVIFDDAEVIASRMKIAKELGIAGISIFKLDGQGDSRMFAVLRNGGIF